MEKILETERLILRVWTRADARALFEICRDAAVMLHIGTGKPYENVAEANEFLDWAIAYQKENVFAAGRSSKNKAEKSSEAAGLPYANTKTSSSVIFSRAMSGDEVRLRKRRARVSNTVLKRSGSFE